MATTQEVEQQLRDKASEVLGTKNPPIAPPVVKPVAPKAGAGKAVPKTIATLAAKQAMGIDTIPQGIMSDTKQIMADRDKQLAANPLPSEPLAKFTPEQQKSFSTLSSMLLVLGSLMGRKTMAPATAALNNMTGVMQGIKQGNAEAYTKNKQEFDANYKVAMENYNRALDRRKEIMAESKGDLAVEKELMNQWRLNEGISEKYSHDQMTHDIALQKHGVELAKVKNQVDQWMAGLVKPDLTAQTKPAKGASADVTRLNLERDKEIAKSPKRAAEINARFDQQIKAMGGGAAPASAAPSGKPTPSQSDIDYVKAHPETKAAFVAHFGVEPDGSKKN